MKIHQQKYLTIIFKEGNIEKINSHNFSIFLKLIDDFIVSIESISKKKTATLRSWQQNQTNKYLNKFHSERKDRLELAIDSESWKISILPYDFENLIENIFNNFFQQPENFVYRIVRESDSNFLYINEEKHIFFGIVVILIKLTLEYLQLESSISGFSNEFSLLIIELYKVTNINLCFCFITKPRLRSLIGKLLK